MFTLSRVLVAGTMFHYYQLMEFIVCHFTRLVVSVCGPQSGFTPIHYLKQYSI